MDLRIKVKNIMRKYGHDVFLRRYDPNMASSSTGPYERKGGYPKKFEKHTTRQRMPGVGSLLGRKEEEIEGIVVDVDQIFYFMHKVNPREHDRIYVSDPTKREVYEIEWAHPFRFRNGRVEYWAVGANDLEDGEEWWRT